MSVFDMVIFWSDQPVSSRQLAVGNTKVETYGLPVAYCSLPTAYYSL